jgi:DNA polymerase (family 10)
MNNYEIADHFALLGKLMDIHGENSFKSKSYSVAAFNIEKLPKEIEQMDDAELFGIRGIGEAIGKKIRELTSTGKLPLLEKVLEATPQGLLEMMQIKGLGPKKIAVIWKEMGIESLGENILQSILYFKQNLGFHLWAETEVVAESVVAKLKEAYPQQLFSITGDVRRQHETIEFIDILTDMNRAVLAKQFDGANMEEDEQYLTVKLEGQPRLRFSFAGKEDFYRQLFLGTGSEIFIDAFGKQYSVPAKPASEEEIFTANKLAYIPPALRETAHVLEKAANNTLPELITKKDIKGIIHSHSTWSDGVHTIEQMARSAMQQGFEYLVISDHSQSAFYANGLNPERIAAQHQEVDALNVKLAPFKIFKSIEADILNDGRLDYTDNVLNTFDLVIGSVHSNLKMSEEKAMERVLTAVKNPYLAILGHPTGRLLLSRKGYPLDHKKLIDTCAEYNVVIEINAHPRRLDIDWRWIDYALERNVLLSIDPDAHSIDGFHDIHYGAMIAQKGGLTAKNNLSSYSLTEFEAFLAKYREKKKAAVSIPG